MQPDRWETLSSWFNTWLAADATERERLKQKLAAEHPDLVGDAETLTTTGGQFEGFLDTPALLVAARELAEDDSRLAAGAMVGPYRIVELLARGGMGDVYRATDVRLERDVALKILAPSRTGDPQRVQRFTHEARVTASLDHPNIVRVYDVGRAGEHHFLVAELLEGETLRQRIARGPLPVAEARRIGVDIARGLVAAHAAGLVHRDLKPENIFLTKSGTIRILDFGIAKLAQDESVASGLSTLTGVVLGTAGYLAPEQIRGAAVDGRTDLFSLGVLLFEMLTGARPFAREHLVETLHGILHDTPPPTLAEREDVPPALTDLVLRLLEKSPDDRIQSAEGVITALETVGTTATSPWPAMRPAATPTHARPLHRRFPRAATAAAGIVALTALAAAILLVASGRRVSTVTLAVIPFQYIPAGGDSEFLEIGLADLFISRLGQLTDLRVPPVTVTEKLRGKDPQEAGRAVGATHVLTGTLQRDKERIRATVQLIATTDNRVIMSAPVDTDASSVFDIQDIIVTRVIDELAPRLDPDARRRLAQAGTRNSQAYDAFVKGRAHVLTPTPVALRQALASFEQATRLDPNYADAWAGIGWVYKRLPLVDESDPRIGYPKGRDAADRALKLQPEHAEALSVKGTVALWYEWNYEESERLLRQAAALQPNSPDTHLFLAHVLSNVGRHDEALQEIRRARALDAEFSQARALEGQILHFARRYDQALAHLEAMNRVEPDFWTGHMFRVPSLIAERRYEEAVRGCDLVLELRQRQGSPGTPRYAIAQKGFAQALMGRRAEAQQELATLRERARTDYVPPYHEALILHGLGRDDEALRQLAQSIATRDYFAIFLGVDPRWDGLRQHPEFRKILQQANLLEVSDRMSRP